MQVVGRKRLTTFPPLIYKVSTSVFWRKPSEISQVFPQNKAFLISNHDSLLTTEPRAYCLKATVYYPQSVGRRRFPRFPPDRAAISAKHSLWLDKECWRV